MLPQSSPRAFRSRYSFRRTPSTSSSPTVARVRRTYPAQERIEHAAPVSLLLLIELRHRHCRRCCPSTPEFPPWSLQYALIGGPFGSGCGGPHVGQTILSPYQSCKSSASGRKPPWSRWRGGFSSRDIQTSGKEEGEVEEYGIEPWKYQGEEVVTRDGRRDIPTREADGC